MKKQISRISPFQTAKVMAVLYFVMSIPLALIFLVVPTPPGMYSGMLAIILPVGYLVGGFVFSLIGAWIYNLVAKFTGGFEFTTVEVPGGDFIG